MVNILVYFTVFLIILTILLLIISSLKGVIQSKGNFKKTLLKTFPILICVTPCIIILGTSMYNMFLMMFGSDTVITISQKLQMPSEKINSSLEKNQELIQIKKTLDQLTVHRGKKINQSNEKFLEK